MLDLKKRFGIHAETGKCRVIVVRYEDEKVGLLVDEIDKIVSFTHEEITTPLAMFKGLKTEYLTGLGKKEDRIIILLNIERLLTSEEKIVLSASSDSFSSANPDSMSGLMREESTSLIEEKDAGTGKSA